MQIKLALMAVMLFCSIAFAEHDRGDWVSFDVYDEENDVTGTLDLSVVDVSYSARRALIRSEYHFPGYEGVDEAWTSFDDLTSRSDIQNIFDGCEQAGGTMGTYYVSRRSSFYEACQRTNLKMKSPYKNLTATDAVWFGYAPIYGIFELHARDENNFKTVMKVRDFSYAL